LAEQSRSEFARRCHRPDAGFTEAALTALVAHAWPGNVRELRNAIERAVILAAGEPIDLVHLPVGAATVTTRPAAGNNASLREVEVSQIRRVLATAASLEEAARILDIDPATLWRKRKKYGL